MYIIHRFEATKVVKLSQLKEYRTVELEVKLNPGDYMIIPRYNTSIIAFPKKKIISTQTAGQIGKFILNIYFSTMIQVTRLGANIPPEEIAEESERVEHVDETIKRILKFKYLFPLPAFFITIILGLLLLYSKRTKKKKL